MAKPKLDLKDLLLRRGELIAMGACGLCLVVLLVWGASKRAGAKDPSKATSELAQASGNVTDLIKTAPPSKAEEDMLKIPPFFKEAGAFNKARAEQFPMTGTLFDPTGTPSTKRDNPIVLPIGTFQVDLTRSAMPGYDIIYDENGEAQIAVLAQKRESKLDDVKIKAAIEHINSKTKKGNNRPKPMGMGMGTMPPGMGMGPPGPGMGPPMGMGGPEGRGGGSPYGFSGGEYDASSKRDEKAVIYIPLKELDESVRKGQPPAFTVIPQRLVTVHAVVPYKKQIEELKRALRLPTEDAAKLWGPWYDGFEVQRKVTKVLPSGEVLIIEDWPPKPKDPKDTTGNYKFEEAYIDNIDTRKLADHFDVDYIPYFLKPEMMLSMPLPQLAKDLNVTYPTIRLKEINDNIEKLEKASRPKLDASELQKRLQGTNPKNEIYKQRTGTDSGLTGIGYAADRFGGPKGSTSGSGMGTPMMPTPKCGPGSPAPPEGYGYNPNGTVTPTELVDNFLLRFVDCDVKPGHTYEYRIRLRMWNPNFEQKDLVANPEYAKESYRTLYSKWTQLDQSITVPAESFLYAYDVKKYREDTARDYDGQKELLGKMQIKDNQAVVQVATWMEQVRTDNSSKREPVGSWVVSEMPVTRGHYVGRKQYVKLPLWASETQQYVLRELTDKVLKGKDQPKGWLVDFSTKSVLVDFEGGRMKTTVKTSFDKNGNVVLGERPIDEDSATEVLIVRADGKLVVRSSAADEADANRKDIVSKWTEWLKRVENNKASTGTGMMGDDPFNMNPPKKP